MKSTLHFISFNQDQRELICSIINRFGSGQHPYADDNTFSGFTISYLKEILEKKRFKSSIGNLNETGKKVLAEIQTKLTEKHYSEIKYMHAPTKKVYTSNGASGLINENNDSPLPLWLTENSLDWVKLQDLIKLFN